MKNLSTCCLILIFIISFTGFGQQRDFIAGKVIDTETDEPIVFANIRIKDRELGVISNVDGGFKIPLKYRSYGGIIEISSMGYQVLAIDINDFDISGNNLIKLKPNVEVLEEVVLVYEKKKAPNKKELKAKDIIRKAIEGIDHNYPKTPFSYVGYYRDYQVKNQSRFNFNEAIFEVFDNGFQTNDLQNTNHKLYEYTRNTAFPRDVFGEKAYDNQNKFIPGATIQSRRGNELLILRNMDAIRNYNIDTYSFVNQFENDFVTNHFFKKNDDVQLGDVNLYSISITKRTATYLVFGEIFISKTSFAIYKFDYEVFERDAVSNSNISHESLKKEVTPLFTVSLGYLKRNGLMYPSYISFTNQFVTYSKPKFIVEKVSINSIEKCVEVRFSSMANRNDVRRTNRYLLEYDGNAIKVADISQEGKNVKLHFSKSTWEDLEKMIQAKNIEDIDYAKLKLTVIKLNDVDDNLINAPEEIKFSQFREFFVQKVSSTTNLHIEKGFMRKDIPIFQDQPIVKPDNFGDYWMNTPLKRKD